MPALMSIQRIILNVCLVLALTFASATSVFAAQSIQNMYEALVPLADRSEPARKEAIVEGLEQVLVRYSGYSGIGSLSGVSSALSNADAYVIEFAVETEMVPAEDNLSVEKAEALWVRYNASQVDSLFDQQQLPIWSSVRPDVQYLVVQQLWGEPTLMTAQSFPAIEAALDSVFSERGLPAVSFDSPELPVDRIWQMREVDAYSLYHQSGADLLVLVRILDGSSQGQRAEVLIVQEDGLSMYREQTGTAMSDVSAAINEFVDSYSANYAFLGGTGQASDIYISVLGLEAFSGYRRFLDVLSGLEQVSLARLEALKGDQMLFRVAYGSNKERLLADIGKQTGLTTVSRQFNALGARTSPLILASPDYRAPEVVEQIFVQPAVVLPPLLPEATTEIAPADASLDEEELSN